MTDHILKLHMFDLSLTSKMRISLPACSLAVSNNVINANLVLNGVYYLVQQQYVYSPPNSQCALTAANLPTLPAATVTSSLSFYNGYQVVFNHLTFLSSIFITLATHMNSFVSTLSLICFLSHKTTIFLYSSTVTITTGLQFLLPRRVLQQLCQFMEKTLDLP